MHQLLHARRLIQAKGQVRVLEILSLCLGIGQIIAFQQPGVQMQELLDGGGTGFEVPDMEIQSLAHSLTKYCKSFKRTSRTSGFFPLTWRLSSNQIPAFQRLTLGPASKLL